MPNFDEHSAPKVMASMLEIDEACHALRDDAAYRCAQRLLAIDTRSG